MKITGHETILLCVCVGGGEANLIAIKFYFVLNYPNSAV